MNLRIPEVPYVVRNVPEGHKHGQERKGPRQLVLEEVVLRGELVPRVDDVPGVAEQALEISCRVGRHTKSKAIH